MKEAIRSHSAPFLFFFCSLLIVVVLFLILVLLFLVLDLHLLCLLHPIFHHLFVASNTLNCFIGPLSLGLIFFFPSFGEANYLLC